MADTLWDKKVLTSEETFDLKILQNHSHKYKDGSSTPDIHIYRFVAPALYVIYSEDFSLPFCHSAKRMARQPRGVISWLQKVESTGGWSLNAENNPKLVVNSLTNTIRIQNNLG